MKPTLRLFAAGASILFWELALIRWLGSNARVVAYYSNFVLTAAFFGLGVGTLASQRERWRLQRLAFPLVTASVLLGVVLAGKFHYNQGSAEEYVWIGAPPWMGSGVPDRVIPPWAVLMSAYLVTAAAFVPQGYALGRLFRALPPLRAYTVEILGSLAGILLFSSISAFRFPPAVWFGVGAILLLPFLARSRSQAAVAIACTAIVVGAGIPASRSFTWSPYYKLAVEPIRVLHDFQTGNPIKGGAQPFGYSLTVNHDFFQAMLDLRAPDQNPVLRSVRDTYDAPYRDEAKLPPGPILVVGAGSGNDVAAALRSTTRAVEAVEIDPAIIEVGKRLHPEKPYQNPRVTVINDDARSFFQRTKQKYALVVFGFLDSHTLLSTYTSVRLDNFIYTRESLARVRQLLVPGGQLYISFSSNTSWIHQRITNLITEAFGRPAIVDIRDHGSGVVYHNVNLPETDGARAEGPAGGIEIPTDDWPFLYLRSRTIPDHYAGFAIIIVLLGTASLLLLPRGQRRVRTPFFLMGAAFFLLETSNVVRLSILFGSTWLVNILVFSAILVLVLLANLTRARSRRLGLGWVSLLLLATVAIGYFVPTHVLLAIGSRSVRAAAAGIIFLAPVYFAGLLFATLIENETSFYQAYASNVLGAMVGGACEYLSLIIGFKVLVLVTLAFYVATVFAIGATKTSARSSSSS